MRISDWSSDVCSSDRHGAARGDEDRGDDPGRREVQEDRGYARRERGEIGRRAGMSSLVSVMTAAWQRLVGPAGRNVVSHDGRSAERPVGKGSVSTCSTRGAPYNKKKKKSR